MDTLELKTLEQHSLRFRLVNEAHIRPYIQVKLPCRASHLAFTTRNIPLSHEHTHIKKLCEHYGVVPPVENSKHYSENFRDFLFKWERHNEFSTYTFLRQDEENIPFDRPAIKEVPENWLAELNYKLLVALHLVILPRTTTPPTQTDLHRYFSADSLVGSSVIDEAALVWTDFRIHSDGFSRMLILDRSLHARQTGRLLQELLEMESYRILALLGFPLAESLNPMLGKLDQRLTRLSRQMVSISTLEEEHSLLSELANLEAEIEKLNSETAYRFGATRAYHSIVEHRIVNLKEVELGGLQTLSSFLERRFLPAMNTCESISSRLEHLSRRVARASQILSARVDLALESQNRDLLHSMDRRAHYQFRLQETVEGLSIAAISYYVVGLVNYVLKGIESAGYQINPEAVLGGTIPIVIASVWFTVRRIKNKISKSNPSE